MPEPRRPRRSPRRQVDAPAPRRVAKRRPSVPAPPAGNQRAQKIGAQSQGRNLETWERTRADVEAALEASPWLAPSDHLLLEVFASELSTYRHAAAALQRLSPTALNRKLSAQRLQIRRSRVLGELADRLGLSPQSRYDLGLVVAQTEAVTVKPVRTVERAQAVGRLLRESGALPPDIDGEATDQDDGERTPGEDES